MEAAVRARPRPGSERESPRPWLRYFLGRCLQIVGLLVTLMAATQYFGTPSTTAMLRTMLLGVAVFVPGWLLARSDPRR
jgi:drug/metabolite transporter (DMT)-like permease